MAVGWAAVDDVVMSQPVSGRQSPPASALVLAVGIAALAFGSLIAAFSPGGRTPGLVIVGVGVVLTVPGFVLVRRARDRQVYRVTRRWSTGLLLAAVGVGAVVVAGSFGIVIGLDALLGVRVPAVALFVPGGLLVLRYYLDLRTALLVHAQGVVVDGVPTSWAELDQLVLTPGADAVTIEVRRRADAPAPEHGPVAVEVPAGRITAADLAAAVRKFGSTDVEVVEGRGTGAA